MNSAAQRIARYACYTAALAWPLDVFQFIPGLGISLVAVALGAMTLALVLDMLRREKFQVPFEVLWPAGLIAVLLVAAAYTNAFPVSAEWPASLLLFLVTTHFARSKSDIESWLRASVPVGTAAALLTAFGPANGLVPTAYTFQSNATFMFSYSMAGGAHILVLCALIALFLTRRRSQHFIVRTLLTVCLILIGATLIVKVLQTALGEWPPLLVDYGSLSPLAGAAIATTLWLVCRVVAKVHVDRRDAPPGLHRLFLYMAAASLLVAAFMPLEPRLYHGFLLGLACGYVLPGREDRPALAWPRIATLAVVALLLINAVTVFPEHERDPRNYEASAIRDIARGDYSSMLRRMEHFEQYAPGEQRMHLWRARAALERGDPNGASVEFALSVESAGTRLMLPGPTTEERETFLVDLRDRVSILSEIESVCAYERALLANAQRDAALYSLQLQTNIALAHAQTVPVAPLAEAVAFIIGDDSIREDLEGWSADELLTLLSQWGAQVGGAPEGFPVELLPAVFVAQRGGDAIYVLARLGEERVTYTGVLPPAKFRDRGDEAAPRMAWSEVELSEDGAWRLALEIAGDGSQTLGEVKSSASNTRHFTWLDRSLTDIPFTPAIRVYLP